MHTQSPALLLKMSKEGHKAGSWVIKLCNGFWLGLTHCICCGLPRSLVHPVPTHSLM